jgi:hypothetical protein
MLGRKRFIQFCEPHRGAAECLWHWMFFAGSAPPPDFRKTPPVC